MNKRPDLYKLSPIGESALLLALSDRISLDANDRIRSLDFQLRDRPLEGVLEWTPGYASMLVFYDPAMINFEAVESYVIACLQDTSVEAAPPPRQIVAPTCYGGACGPDLEEVAAAHGFSPSEVVRLHSAPTYRVGMMGFTPGFAYLIGLDPKLATPRRDSPRTLVPAGSVGIAGSQTGIYPLDSPGGWQLIGRTEQTLYDPESEDPFLLSPGDEVRFEPLPEGVMP